MTTKSIPLFTCNFEVFGIVQGVFFRKHTQKQAKSLGLHGWCENTNDGTVRGILEGPTKQICEMRHWLEHTGSPTSRIDKACFSEIKPIQAYTFKDFKIQH